MQPVGNRFDIIVPAVCSDNDIDGLASLTYEKFPFSTFNLADGLINSLLPAASIIILAPHILDPFIGVHPVGFINATNACSFGHKRLLSTVTKMKKAAAFSRAFVSGSSTFFGSNCLAAEVNTLLQNVVHSARIDPVRSCYVVLIVALPVQQPYIHGIFKRKSIGL
jgi:hypothetical protein